MLNLIYFSMKSPYTDIPKDKWIDKTIELTNSHPLKNEIVQIVTESWNTIFKSSIGGFRIGIDIFPTPQIMGVFLHTLIALFVHKKHPEYKLGDSKSEKDIHNSSNTSLSIEIKTSSDKNKIFANRSYAQPQDGDEKKNKDGYYIAVNFEKFSDVESGKQPQIRLIRFGYIEHSDWIAQASPKGQQAHLDKDTYNHKFITLFQKE